MALIVAHCQRGDDPQEAVDRWFSLLDTPDPFLEWLTRRWGRSDTRVGTPLRRQGLVNEAIASLFEDATPPEAGRSRGPEASYERSLP
ncbi:MAG: hypothetical protein F4185_02690 [Chloroflexi bacterium]|nr:hypothetical protein [Chloroflexota bacterium]